MTTATMPDKCPRCGAERTGIGTNGVLYACFSGHLDGEDIEGPDCLRRQNEALRGVLKSVRGCGVECPECREEIDSALWPYERMEGDDDVDLS